jgi:tetratricopeptide (TPR) repeat protein
LRLFRALDNKPGIARSLSNLGVVAKEQGDYASATALYQESLAIRRQLQDTWSIAALQINLGEIAREQGDLAQAESAYRESLRLFETRGDDVGKAVAFNNLGELARERLDYEAAIDFHNKSLNLREKNRDTLGIARSRTKLAKLYSLKANYSEAAQHLADSLARCKQAGAEQDLLCCLQDVAELVFAFGSPRQSLPLLAATQDLRTKLGLSSSKEQQSESQQMLIAMQSMFDDATLTELRDQGSNMTFAQATEYGASIVNDIQIAARYINPALHDASTNVVLSRSG